MLLEFKKVEEGIVPIYENETKERLINARELHDILGSRRDFTNWVKDRIHKYKFIEKEDFIVTFTKIGERKNVIRHDYYLTLDTSKEICMIENSDIGRKIRKYFIEAEKRYRNILNNSNNTNQLIDIMQNAINYMRENKIPHSNLIGAIARQLGYKISYKHYYEDEYIAIIKDISKNEYWQVYFKSKAVQEIIDWFNKNKDDIYYEIQYIRNTKNGKKGEIKERGYKIEEICYKII